MRAPGRIGALAAAVLALVPAACAVGPDYVRPKTPAPSQPGGGAFVSASADISTPAPPPANWWRLYDDPALNALVEDALAHNKSLLQSAANLLEARAALSEARAGRFPSTDLTGSAQYGVSGTSILVNSLRSGGTSGYSAGSATTPQTYYAYGMDVSYEVDLFGRVTRTIQAARRDAEAQAAELDALRVSVAGETTRAYLNACAYAQETTFAKRALDAVQQGYRITLKQQAAGAVSDYEVAQELALLEQTRSTLPTYEAERKSALFQLAVLTGQPPEAVSKAADACARPPRLSQLVPVGDGRALIARRPDVRVAERQLAANVARIGVATADLYPTITLGGSAQEEATRLGNLASVGSLSYLLGPLISWSFPNTLVAQARIREARATASASVANFQGVVLQALQDVETSLSTYQGELRRNAGLKSSIHQDLVAYNLARVRYANGSIAYLDLLTSETSLVNAELTLAASDQALASDQATLFKALGGGWEQAPAVTPPAIADAKKGGATTPVH